MNTYLRRATVLACSLLALSAILIAGVGCSKSKDADQGAQKSEAAEQKRAEEYARAMQKQGGPPSQ